MTVNTSAVVLCPLTGSFIPADSGSTCKGTGDYISSEENTREKDALISEDNSNKEEANVVLCPRTGSFIPADSGSTCKGTSDYNSSEENTREKDALISDGDDPNSSNKKQDLDSNDKEWVILEILFRKPRYGCKSKAKKTWKDYRYRCRFQDVSSGTEVIDWISPEEFEPLEEYLIIHKPRMYGS